MTPTRLPAGLAGTLLLIVALLYLGVLVALPLVVGVPERTPPVERLRLRGVSCVPPAVTVQVVYVPEPPVAASGCE